ncbi:glucosyltransferase domain-containing protein [Acetatifactor aquisgranensis]|uniref:glucosyltransferase domain-containing protein n=1 Tax=Acetatifactor aquisgranensis TaxID=2941233 RepID=UPI00203C9B5A|nr:glucosyltransferase domain-containing protein [Acetatifactor aquisgranensis]
MDEKIVKSEKNANFERTGLWLIIACFFSVLLSWNMCSEMASKICMENIVTIKMIGNMGEKANVWLNWYPGLKIIENKGFIEAEDTHYISSESGSVLSFYTENVASGNIMCIFEGGYSDLSINSGMNSQRIQWDGNEAGNMNIVVQQKEYLTFAKTFLTILFVLVFGTIVFWVGKLLLTNVRIWEFVFQRKHLPFGLFLIWGIGILGGMLQTTFSVDDYTYYLSYSNGYKFNIKDYRFILYATGRREGRIINGLLYVILDALCRGVYLLYQPFTVFLCIVLLAAIAKVIYEIFIQTFEIEPKFDCRNLIAFFGAGLFVFNPFLVEVLTFHKVNLIFLIGAFCAVWAAKVYLGSGKGKSLWTEVLLLLSVFIYQPYGAWFVMLCSMSFLGEYLRQRQQRFQRWIIDTFKMLLLYAIPILINLISMVTLGDSPRMSVSGTGDKLEKFFREIKLVMVSGHGRMETPYFLIYFLLMIVVIILLGITRKLRKDFYPVFFMTTGILVGIVFYFQLATTLWSIDERTCFMVMGIPGFLAIMALGIIGKGEDRKRLEQLLLISIGVLGLAYARDTQIDVVRVIAANITDSEVCRIYQSEIEAYEAENHIKVEKVAFLSMYNSYSSVYNEGIDNSTRPYWSALHVAWSKLEILNLVSGRDYALYEYDANGLMDDASLSSENGVVHFRGEVALIEIY